MSRLASLTPSRSRASLSPSPSSTPTSRASLQTETTHHRKTKLVILEVRNLFKLWDELVLVDGMKAAKGCIDEATEMDNIIALEESDERPSVVEHLEKLYEYRAALDNVLVKLDKALGRFALLIEQAENIFFEAYRTQGLTFTSQEPLWSTWTLEHLINTLSPLFTLYNKHYTLLTQLAASISDPKTSFDDAKLDLERWRDTAIRGERVYAMREWEELIDLELSEAGGEEVEEVDDFGPGSARKGKKKGKR